MKNNIRGRAARVAAVGTLVLALAACSASPAPSASGGKGGELTIGLASILTGAASATGVALDCGVEAYLEGVNKSGGVDGYTFNFIERDTQFDPAKASAIAKEFLADNAFTVVTTGTATIQALGPILSPSNTPLFGLGDGVLFTPPGYDGAFGLNPDTRREAAGGARFILDTLKEKTASLAYVNTAVGQPASTSFPAYYEANGGKVATTVPIDQTATDFAPYAQKLKRAGSPVVYAFALDTQIAALQKASAAIGYHPKWVSWSVGFTPSYITVAGDAAKGTYVSQFTEPLTGADATKDAETQKYLKAVKAKCPDSVNATAAASGWTLGAIIEHGVKAGAVHGKVTKKSFIKSLSGQKLTGVGLVPTIDYAGGAHVGATSTAYFKIQSDGGLKAVTKYAELPPAK